MQIKAEEISKIIEDQIKNYEQRVEMSETGTVLYVGDGIARVYGVQNAMAMELLEFPGGVMGMVLNLEEDNVGVALLVVLDLILNDLAYLFRFDLHVLFTPLECLPKDSQLRAQTCVQHPVTHFEHHTP